MIAAKARVTPLKSQSIVKLEFTAATEAARLVKWACDTLGKSIKEVVMWVDALDNLALGA